MDGMENASQGTSQATSLGTGQGAGLDTAASSGAAETPEAASHDAMAGAGGATAAENAGAEGKPQGAGGEVDPEDMPIKDFAKIDLGLGGDVDADLVAGFGEQAVALGLTPRQAKALAAWQYSQGQAMRERQTAAGVAELAAEWGAKAQANQNAVLAAIANVDRALASDKLGQTPFSDAIARSGAACDANFVRGMLLLANLGAEDSIGSSSAGAPQQKPESPLEALQQIFGKKN